MYYVDTNAALPTFFVFAGDVYYPGGGMEDFRSAHTDRDEAEQAARALTEPGPDRRCPRDWAHVAEVTPAGLSIIASFGRG